MCSTLSPGCELTPERTRRGRNGATLQRLLVRDLLEVVTIRAVAHVTSQGILGTAWIRPVSCGTVIRLRVRVRLPRSRKGAIGRLRPGSGHLLVRRAIGRSGPGNLRLTHMSATSVGRCPILVTLSGSVTGRWAIGIGVGRRKAKRAIRRLSPGPGIRRWILEIGRRSGTGPALARCGSCPTDTTGPDRAGRRRVVGRKRGEREQRPAMVGQARPRPCAGSHVEEVENGSW